MQKLILLTILFYNTAMAQVDLNNQTASNQGMLIGLGLGAGTLSLKYNDTVYNKFSTTLPNIKIGYKFNKKIALCILLPGANYKYNKKDRGFEAFVPAIQYWINPKWWALLGTGLTFDAPAFYTVDDPKKAAFYTGIPAITFATGYEILHKKNFGLDLQYRFFAGKSVIEPSKYRTGLSNMLLVGFNWKI